MKALSKKTIEDTADEEMLICCNCAFVDTKASYISRCIGDKEVICPACSSRAFLVFEQDSSAFINERVSSLVGNDEDSIDDGEEPTF